MSTGQPIITDMKVIDNKSVLGKCFKIVVSDVHTVRYEDNNSAFEVEIEGGIKAGKVDWLVYVHTFKVIQILDAASTQVSREEVLKRIDQALSLLDMPHRMV